jgi:hypothetical protein
MHRLDIIGEKYGRLTVLEFSHVRGSNSFWKCLCDCGNFHVASANKMRTGDCLSCGCLKALKHPRGQTGLNILYMTYKKNALKRGLNFNLSIEEFKSITSKNCSYCGIEPQCLTTHSTKNDLIRGHISYRYNGIDRVDSGRGYEISNIVPCCKWCNIAKADKPLEEFKSHILKMLEHMG